jgi:hypothetical protein
MDTSAWVIAGAFDILEVGDGAFFDGGAFVDVSVVHPGFVVDAVTGGDVRAMADVRDGARFDGACAVEDCCCALATLEELATRTPLAFDVIAAVATSADAACETPTPSLANR